jgi:hypothetical protein
MIIMIMTKRRVKDLSKIEGVEVNSCACGAHQ